MMNLKKLFVFVLSVVLLLCLSGCAPKEEVVYDSADVLAFQNVPWNATPEEVCEKLGLDLDTLERTETAALDSFNINVYDCEVFGEQAIGVAFGFSDPYGRGYSGLGSIQIVYPDGYNKEAILNALRREYGQDAQEYTYPQLGFGGVEEVTYVQGEDDSARWFSKKLFGDVLSEKGKQAYSDFLKNGTEDAESTVEALLDAPVATMTWRPDYNEWLKQTFTNPPITYEGKVGVLNIEAGMLALGLAMENSK